MLIDIKYLTMKYSDEINKMLIETNGMVKFNSFVFNGIWDMEPCIVPYKNNKKWNKINNKDPEWTYMFNRMDYLYKLVYAYQLTGSILYIDYGLSMIKDWMKCHMRNGQMKKNIFFRKKNCRSTRTLDISILIVNVIDFLMYCKKIPNYNINDFEIKDNISGIIGYILDRDNAFKTNSNWGLIENLNILYCSHILDLKINKKKLFNRLKNQFQNQILSDGSHVESSPMYLVQIILCIFKSIKYSNGELYCLLEKYLTLSLNYLITIRTPNNAIPNFGDSDLTNISDIMHLSSIILSNNKYLSYADKKLNLEFYYKYNIESLCSDVTYIEDRQGIIELDQQTIISDMVKGVYLLCSNTKRFSGHKHYDYLSFILYVNKQPFFIDSGRYTYACEKHREDYVGPSAHNTVIIDDNHYHYIDSWSVNEKVSQLCVRKGHYKNVQYIEMTVHFLNDSEIKRYFIYDESIGLIIFDSCNTITDNNYKAFFNLSKECKIKTKDGFYELYNKHSSIFLKSYRLRGKLFKRNASNKYNEEFDINRIVFEGKVNSNIYLIAFEDEFESDLRLFEEINVNDKTTFENFTIINLCEIIEKYKDGQVYEIYK